MRRRARRGSYMIKIGRWVSARLPFFVPIVPKWNDFG